MKLGQKWAGWVRIVFAARQGEEGIRGRGVRKTVSERERNANRKLEVRTKAERWGVDCH